MRPNGAGRNYAIICHVKCRWSSEDVVLDDGLHEDAEFQSGMHDMHDANALWAAQYYCIGYPLVYLIAFENINEFAVGSHYRKYQSRRVWTLREICNEDKVDSFVGRVLYCAPGQKWPTRYDIDHDHSVQPAISFTHAYAKLVIKHSTTFQTAVIWSSLGNNPMSTYNASIMQ